MLTKLGKQVTVLEALDRVLARVAGEPLSRFFEAEHRAHGVDLRTGVTVEGIEETRRRGDRRSPCRRDGHPVRDGDRRHRHHPGGRAAARGGRRGRQWRRWSMRIAAPACPISSRSAIARRTPIALRMARSIRLESVQNANDQASVVARGALRRARAPMTRCRGSGRTNMTSSCRPSACRPAIDAAVVRGDPATRSFSIVYLKAGQGYRARLRQHDPRLCSGPRACRRRLVGRCGGAGRSRDIAQELGRRMKQRIGRLIRC